MEPLSQVVGDPPLSAGEMVVRAVLIYAAALVLIRIGHRRFLGQGTALDFVLAVLLGSVLSRAVSGNAPFLPTLAAGAALVALHWVAAALAFHFHGVNVVLRNPPRMLVRDGEIQWESMRRSHVIEEDLREGLRRVVQDDDLEQVSRAYLESSGHITGILRRPQLQVVEVRVEEGVQTVRIELG